MDREWQQRRSRVQQRRLRRETVSCVPYLEVELLSRRLIPLTGIVCRPVSRHRFRQGAPLSTSLPFCGPNWSNALDPPASLFTTILVII